MRSPFGRWAKHVVGAVTAGILVASCAPAPGTGTGTGTGMVQFDPVVTDAASKSYPLSPSFARQPTGTPRNELAVLFNGTGAAPSTLSRMGATLAAEGFHVIGLKYESHVGTMGACPDSVATTNPDCHRQFRGEVVHGAGVADPSGAAFDHPAINVTAPNSVVSRLLKHVEYLTQRYPLTGWEQFQQRAPDGSCATMSTAYGACAANWGRIVGMGHSQGAGVALYLAKHYPLARVGMLSGPYDIFRDGDGTYVPAPWLTEGGFAVHPVHMRTFSHLGDPAIPIHRAAADAAGILGVEVVVTLFARPYGYTRRIVSNAPPTCPFDSAQTHNSTATDSCAPALHEDAWRYLATGQ
jgi:hypothetical protein